MQDDYDEVDLPNMDGEMQHDEAPGDASDDDGAECDPWPPVDGESPSRPGKSYHGSKDQAEIIEQSYEDMCKAYVEKYLSGVEVFLQQSGLAARVNEWQVLSRPCIATALL